MSFSSKDCPNWTHVLWYYEADDVLLISSREEAADIKAVLSNNGICQWYSESLNVAVEKAKFWIDRQLKKIAENIGEMPRVATKWSTEPDEEGRRKLLGFCDYQDDVKEQSPSSPSDSFIDEVVSVIDELRGWTPPFNVDERLELVAAWDRASKLQIKLAAMKAARIAGENNSGNLPSVEDLWEIYSHLQLLRSEEASQVTFTAPNPDDNDLPNEVVGVKDLWTEWLEVDFRGATLLECLRKAVDARRAWYVAKEAKRLKLLPKT